MEKLIIEGGVPLSGEINLSGAKNSGYKIIIASLLADSPSLITGFPQIGDVEITKEIIKKIGGRTKEEGEALKIFPQKINSFQVPFEFGEKSRTCILFVGPLLFRFGKAVVPFPGGDRIGERPLERHFEGLETLGVKVRTKGEFFELSAPKLQGGRYRFSKNTHTGTENLIMTAVGAEGETVLENAAQEPEVDDLIAFLNKMGAKVKRVRPRTIVIKGVKKFSGAKHWVMPDKNEAVTFAIASLATGGDILVKRAEPDLLVSFLEKFKVAGGDYEIKKEGIRFRRKGKIIKATNITTGIYPGFLTDWQPLWTVLMTQARGTSIIHETIYPNRFGYVPYLTKMGAKTELFSPKVSHPEAFYNFNWRQENSKYFHAARIFGPRRLHGVRIKIPDIRAGAALCLAALVAKGKSEFSGLEHIDRGYEDLDSKFASLRAKIRREKV